MIKSGIKPKKGSVVPCFRLKQKARSGSVDHDNDRRPLGIVIAGGGTGGHLFPGIAIAQEFRERSSSNRILFIGTEKSIEASILSKIGFNHHTITAHGLKGRALKQRITALLKMPFGILKALMLINGFKPELVIAMGGYAAAPVVIGARLLGIKLVLHEQNTLMGGANRFFSYFADTVFLSFCRTGGRFYSQKTRITGNPVRKELLRQIEGAAEIKQPLPSDRSPIDNQNRHDGRRLFTVLIIGGSQGAHAVNLIMVEAVDYLQKKDAFFFIHQTGRQDEAYVKGAYENRGLLCLVRSFFTDMTEPYKAADLIICRAGATTIAEITAIGKGSVLIPYPYAADNHQVLNARRIADKNAAEMILEKDLSPKLLARRIEYYTANPEELNRMKINAKALGKPDAARSIVNDCYHLLGK